MKERGSFLFIPGIYVYLGIFALVIFCTAVYGHVNHDKTCGLGFSFSFDTLTSSTLCSHSSDDIITKFVRLNHSDNEYDYYYLKLSMFGDKNERLIFYEEARGIEFYMIDKSEIFNDSALFSTHMKDRVQFLSTIADFFYFAKDQKQSEKSSAKTQNNEYPGFYKMIEPGGNGHGSPM